MLVVGRGNPFWSGKSHKSYRPLTTLSFRVNYWFEGLNSTYGYRSSACVFVGDGESEGEKERCMDRGRGHVEAT